MTKPIALFYLRRDFGGGATSYAAHLYRGMQQAGLDVRMYRVAPRSETRARPFAKYDGVEYWNITVEDAVTIAKKMMPSLIAASVHSKDVPFAPNCVAWLLAAGARLVVHDPNEFKVYDYVQQGAKVVRPFCIRPTMRKFYKDAVFVPHPYVRQFDATAHDAAQWQARELHAVSVARVTFVKRTHLILEANDLLPKAQRVVLRGAENRMYTRFKILPQWPKWQQGKLGFPLVWGAAAQECARARYAVDFTYFPDDGGGTQYSLLEAWDAGAVNVVHEDWLRYKGEMKNGTNCLTVSGVQDLAHILKRGVSPFETLEEIVNNGYAALRKHDAAKVARTYYEELTR